MEYRAVIGTPATSSPLPGTSVRPIRHFLHRPLMADARAIPGAISFAVAPGSGDCKGGASAIRVLMAGS